MKLFTTVLLALVILCGAGALLLGLGFWTGHGWRFLPVHRALGVTLVAALCALAALAWRAKGRAGLPLFTIVYALAVAALGAGQAALLPGAAHWVVRVLHLATAGYAIGLGRKLAVAARSEAAGPEPAAVRP